ncbi:putative SorC family transcriptional regulator [Ilumatobacter coccineus YM16-304]|uniref:Putative SorC family transcriptional regulator n=1 Tax=Ilumatobacter coccineus (strain NBRC 103263 / KCTC 29153 / YM16-304) TaxID=1313172 RepID=A0A6C7EAY6_ILUCY|nr:putative SorC family transcriptional regulator [Ilumatobacter coccineus YM16-304]
MPRERLSLLTKVATMYHELGMRQPEIADRLKISQSRVSRLLKEAVSLGIVRTVVLPPPGVFPELERTLCERFGLADAVVTEPISDDESVLLNALGGAAAAYLETTMLGAEVVGISSWSATLLATVEAMQPGTSSKTKQVVQVLGGTGNTAAQLRATRLTERLAHVTGGDPVYLPAPGVVATSQARAALLDDTHIATVVERWADLSMLLVGIGSMQPSPLLHDSGNSLSVDELASLEALGAVGDVCLRFFDANGEPVGSDLDDRVVGIGIDQLRSVPRKVGVAGGARKIESIRAAATGGWIDVLITDRATAVALSA